MVSDAGSFQSEAVLSRQALLEGRRDAVPDFGHQGRKGNQQHQQQHQVALRVLIVNYLRVLAADRRNVALVLLSVLVAFLAFGSVQQQLASYFDIRPLPRDLGYDVLEPLVVSSSSVNLAHSVPVASSIAPIPTVDSVLPTGDLDEDKSLQSETPEPVTSSVESSAPTETAETLTAREVLEAPEPEGEEFPESSESSLDSAGTSVVPTESSEVVNEAQALETAQLETEDMEEPPSSSSDIVETPAASIEPTDPPQSQSEELEEDDDALVDSIQSSAVSEEPETATEPPTSENTQSNSDGQEELP
jgi:hypothetical protein